MLSPETRKAYDTSHRKLKRHRRIRKAVRALVLVAFYYGLGILAWWFVLDAIDRTVENRIEQQLSCPNPGLSACGLDSGLVL